MYKKVLLASDGSTEGLIALREGALIAKRYKARVHLVIISAAAPGMKLADSVHPLPLDASAKDLVERGMLRLKRLGLQASCEVVSGEPAQTIGEQAARFGADLVVVGHRRQGLLERWWSGSTGAYLSDHVGCSVLIARQIISDSEFERNLA